METIEAWLPVFLFSILFGLSMDYEVFLLSRWSGGRLASQAPHRACDGDRLAGDVAGVLAGEERDGGGDVFRFAEPP